MALERTYIIPLRREILKSAKYKRAKKAVSAVKKFLTRHMKAENVKDVKLGRFLNEELWKNGIKNPPTKVKVNVIKNDKGVVTAELFGKDLAKPEEPKKKGLAARLTGADDKVSKKAVKKEAKSGEKKIKEELTKLKERTEELNKEKPEPVAETKAPHKEEKKNEN